MNNTKKYLLSLLVLIVPATNSYGLPTYRITDLGTLGGNSSYGFAVNDYGQVTGWSDTNKVSQGHAFIANPDGNMVSLGTLSNIDYGNSNGAGINNSGQVAGAAYTGTNTHAFVGDENGLTDLGTLGGTARAQDINNQGLITGTSVTGSNDHAFIGDQNGLIDLGTLGGRSSRALGINENGIVTGGSHTTGGNYHAFIGNTNGLTDIGTFHGVDSYYSLGVDINDRGQVVGESQISLTDISAFLWTEENGFTNLGSLGGKSNTGSLKRRSTAYGINNSTQIVGNSYLSNGDLHAFYWDPLSGMVDLNDLVINLISDGWDYLDWASDISNTGYITGRGMIDGHMHAFLLTEIPIPIPLALIALGLLTINYTRNQSD